MNAHSYHLHKPVLETIYLSTPHRMREIFSAEYLYNENAHKVAVTQSYDHSDSK